MPWTIALVLAVLLMIYLILIRPAPVDPDLRRRFAGYYAHRGLHDRAAGIPENSLVAFRQAVEQGYGAEMDLQLSTDGKVVVFHDSKLDRLCGRPGRLEDLSWAEITQLKLLGTDHTPPLFTDVLDTFGGRAPLIIELKTGRHNDALCQAALNILQAYDGPYCIESFDPRIVAWFRKYAPHILRGQLAARYDRDEEPSLLRRLVLTGLLTNILARPHFIAYCHKDRDIVSFRVTRRVFGALTAAWTVRSLDQEQACHGDFDMIIFENYRPVIRA